MAKNMIYADQIVIGNLIVAPEDVSGQAAHPGIRDPASTNPAPTTLRRMKCRL